MVVKKQDTSIRFNTIYRKLEDDFSIPRDKAFEITKYIVDKLGNDDSSYDEGYEDGYEDGRSEGHTEGYEDAKKDAIRILEKHLINQEKLINLIKNM